MDPQLRDALKDVVQRCTGAAIVAWRGETEEYLPVGETRILLSMKSHQAKGVDEHRREYITGVNSGNRVTETGNRLFTLTLRAESYLGEDTQQVLERVQTRITRPVCSAILDDVNCAYIETLLCAEVSISWDNSTPSVYVCDMRFSWGQNDTDTDVDFEGIIESADVTGVYT